MSWKNARPEYLTLKGWNQKTAGIQSFDELPVIAQDYLKRLSDLVDTEISVVSTGPDRKETIIVSPHSRLESWFQHEPETWLVQTQTGKFHALKRARIPPRFAELTEVSDLIDRV